MRVLIPRLIGGALCLVIGLSEAAGKVFRAEELENCQFVVRKIVCTYDQSVYHIRTPVFADPNYQIPVVVILHDAGGNGASIIDDERLIEAFVDKGYAVLAPNALPRGNRRIHYRGERPGMVEAQKTLHPGRFSKKKFLSVRPKRS